MNKRVTDSVPGQAEQLQQVFEQIHQTRMQDMPMVNPVLQVAVTPFEQCEHGEVGILVTPWCMNIVLLPAEVDKDLKPGNKKSFDLPTGVYDFVLAQEPDFGCYFSCSLFSPMFEFKDQATAVATAEAALVSLLGQVAVDEKVVNEKVKEQIEEERPAISRRNFLRGAFRG